MKTEDCNVVSCAGLVTRILDDAYNLPNVGIEHIYSKAKKVGKYDVPDLNVLASTPNAFIRDLNKMVKNKTASAITGAPEPGRFIEHVSEGEIKDLTPGK